MALKRMSRIKGVCPQNQDKPKGSRGGGCYKSLNRTCTRRKIFKAKEMNVEW